ncbi:hypothetical protein BKA61DRAFT_343016 [Leptodontidium sp. MPI-SDFR-AT-0119]|nr:hypothetical protein BKA61DRAFT_343016 [Leptodontidium sp. MPI-SDFR-AT-0119]
MKTTNANTQELRSNSPVDNASPVTPLLSPGTGEKTNNSSIDLILQEVEFIINRKSSCFPFEPKRHALSESEYWELLERVQGESPKFQEFWYNKLRYDCCFRTSSFFIKMPGIIHETVKDMVRESVDEQLKAAKCDIKSAGGGSDLRFEGHYAERQPDVGFRHLNPPQTKKKPKSPYPAFIIEVAASQTSEDLENMAYDYINGSKGKIKTVVGIDVGYKKQNVLKNKYSSKLATISIWKAKTKGRDVEVQKVLDAKPFRNADGSYAEFHDVFFTYNDFTIYTQPPRPKEPFRISISSKFLFDSLVAGEQRLDKWITWGASIESSNNNLRKEPTKPATALPKRSRYEATEDSSDNTDPRLDKNYHGKKRYQHNNKSKSNHKMILRSDKKSSTGRNLRSGNKQ